MRIGIDISQIVHEGTGVSNYVKQLILELITIDTKNHYVLFGSSLRKQNILHEYIDQAKKINSHVGGFVLPLPISFLEFLWNTLHILPVEVLIGDVDVFWSSDWVQPPLKKAIGVTTIHDLTIHRYPESFPKKIRDVHLKKTIRSLSVCSLFFCDSVATKDDVMEFLKVSEDKLRVIYPGYVFEV